jgi:NADH-quinone oxidoreductase subunit F
MKKDRIFTNINEQGSVTLKASQKRGDWKDVQEILEKGPQWVRDQISESEFRERSGHGEYVAKKWAQGKFPYLVINACGNEPGTGIDRYLLRHEPHKILEGCFWVAHALEVYTCYICIRGDYSQEREILEAALLECFENNLLGDLKIHLHIGAGGAICGEDSALLESLEGRKAMPRGTPDQKLYGCSSIVHNLETVATIPTLLRQGALWFSSLGTSKSKGTKLFSLSGHVGTPCVVEEEMGISFKDFIAKQGGDVRGGWECLLAAIPGGASSGFLPKESCEELTLDFESLEAASSCLGTGGIVVFDQSTDIVRIAVRLAQFYKQESCGKCTPCRVGTGWVSHLLDRLGVGRAKVEELDELQEVLRRMADTSLCSFGAWAAAPIDSLLRHFRPELEQRIKLYEMASRREKV